MININTLKNDYMHNNHKYVKCQDSLYLLYNYVALYYVLPD